MEVGQETQNCKVWTDQKSFYEQGENQFELERRKKWGYFKELRVYFSKR